MVTKKTIAALPPDDHDIDQLIGLLAGLKLTAAATEIRSLVAAAEAGGHSYSSFLFDVLTTEDSARFARRAGRQLKRSGLRDAPTLDTFDFAQRSQLSAAVVRQLATCDFVREGRSVICVGRSGTGKTHIATALGVQAIEHHHRRVRFFSTVELVNALEQEKASGNPGQIAHRLMYADMVTPSSRSFRASSRSPSPALPKTAPPPAGMTWACAW